MADFGSISKFIHTKEMLEPNYKIRGPSHRNLI